jgi:hypothetical protein
VTAKKDEQIIKYNKFLRFFGIVRRKIHNETYHFSKTFVCEKDSHNIERFLEDVNMVFGMYDFEIIQVGNVLTMDIKSL